MRLLAAASIACGAADLALAQTCPGEGAPPKAARLVTISESLDMALDDGLVVFFQTLEPPRASVAVADRPKIVAAELTSLLAGRELRVEKLGAPDRWGRTPARLFLAGDATGESADVTLAAAGLAMASRDGGPCAAAVRAAEKQARDANLGLWADPAFAVLAADRPAPLAQRAGTLALVEGRISSTGRTAARLYLNFGTAKGGFFASIARRNQPLFTKAGFSPETLAHKLVRLRGVVESAGGFDSARAQIELFHPDQIEFLDEKPITGALSVPRN